MATITIRHVPDEVVERLKAVAKGKGISMEQEVRELLETRYAAKAEIIERIRQRWEELPPTSAAEVNAWRDVGRP
jgi:plasmid stability protein